MASGSAIRGTKLGSGPMSLAERGQWLRAIRFNTGAQTGTRLRRSSPQRYRNPRPGSAPNVAFRQDKTGKARRYDNPSSRTKPTWHM